MQKVNLNIYLMDLLDIPEKKLNQHQIIIVKVAVYTLLVSDDLQNPQVTKG